MFLGVYVSARTYRRGSSYETTHIRTVRPYGLECKFEPKKGGMTTIFVILIYIFLKFYIYSIRVYVHRFYGMSVGGTFEDPPSPIPACVRYIK